jgi:hypothetical protein
MLKYEVLIPVTIIMYSVVGYYYYYYYYYYVAKLTLVQFLISGY